MNPLIVVQRREDFQTLIDDLGKSRCLAVDTESNGYYAYHERICLIQISTAEHDYILDPLALGDINALGEILADPAIEKVLHAASNDITGLRRDFQFQVQHLFDTALASKLLGFAQLGLANIIREHFGVVLNKKCQRCDWGKRPLTAEQLEYARLDTHYLIPLRYELAGALLTRDLWEKARDIFDKECTQETPARSFDPRGYQRIHGAVTLDTAGQQILRSLYHYRDRRARHLDRAPFRILSNETLLRLARRRPTNLSDLAAMGGLPRIYRNGRLAKELLDTIRKSARKSVAAEAMADDGRLEPSAAPTHHPENQ